MTSAPTPPPTEGESTQPEVVTLDFDPALLRRFAATATTVLRNHTDNVDAEQILGRLCEDAIASVDGIGACVLLLDREADRLYRAASVGWVAEDRIPAELLSATDESNWFAVGLRAGRSLIVDDTAAWPSPSPVRDHAIDAGIRACWIAPLVAADAQPLGTFSVSWTEPHPKSVEHCWVFEEVAVLAQMIVELHQAQWHRMAMIARERNRIAGELHDDSVQAMTAVSLRLQRLAGRIGSEHGPAIREARADVDGAIDRLRHMMFSLHSDTLAEEGLVVSLAIYLESYVEPLGVSFEILGDEELHLAPEVEALAFRLARSALLNVMKHAQARSIRVAVATSARALEVSIDDDGIGFDPEATALSDRPGHLGLAYAESLAASVGGTYTVASRPGAGTEVRFRLPIL